MRLILILALVAITSNLFSQIVVTDENNLPIPFVQIISNNKHFFSQSSLKGVVDDLDLNKLKTDDTLFFYHVSYENAFRKKSDLSTFDTIRLHPKAFYTR